MGDDRVVLHASEYQRLLAGELEGMLALPALVWDEVASICGGVSGPELRSEILACAHTSIGFIDTQVWSRMRAWPWKLAVGDIAANVASMAAL